jgi:hypothetical protein
MTRPARPAPLAIIVCGALAVDVRRILDERDWQADVYGVPAIHHMHPPKIVEAVDTLLGEVADRYDKVIVVYGDCGTSGALDRMLERHRAERTAGEHCYEIYCGCGFGELAQRSPTTYFLTDYLAKNWDEVVAAEMGSDENPALKERFFAGFTSMTYLRQSEDPDLLEAAERVAASLGLPLEIETVGRRELEAELERLISSR